MNGTLQILGTCSLLKSTLCVLLKYGPHPLASYRIRLRSTHATKETENRSTYVHSDQGRLFISEVCLLKQEIWGTNCGASFNSLASIRILTHHLMQAFASLMRMFQLQALCGFCQQRHVGMCLRTPYGPSSIGKSIETRPFSLHSCIS